MTNKHARTLDNEILDILGHTIPELHATVYARIKQAAIVQTTKRPAHDTLSFASVRDGARWLPANQR
jgi:hypothetical protein